MTNKIKEEINKAKEILEDIHGFLDLMGRLEVVYKENHHRPDDEIIDQMINDQSK